MRLTLICRLPQKLQTFREICWNTTTRGIQFAQIVFTSCVALISGHSKPLYGFGFVLGNSISGCVSKSQLDLSFCISRLSPLFQSCNFLTVGGCLRLPRRNLCYPRLKKYHRCEREHTAVNHSSLSVASSSHSKQNCSVACTPLNHFSVIYPSGTTQIRLWSSARKCVVFYGLTEVAGH